MICIIRGVGVCVEAAEDQIFLLVAAVFSFLSRAERWSLPTGTVQVFSCSIEAIMHNEACPWREVFRGLNPGDTIPAAVLRGSRVKEELTQAQLSEMTGIPRRHISEMENGKRPIGKETARKLAQALDCDYRVFL